MQDSKDNFFDHLLEKTSDKGDNPSPKEEKVAALK